MKEQMLKRNDWLTKGMSSNELQTEKALVTIGTEILLKRLDLGLDQKEFAKKMGVSQGMVSRWESGEYNFTISALSKICIKLGLKLNYDKLISEKPSSTILQYQFKPLPDNVSDFNRWSPTDKDSTEGGAA